MIRSCGLIALVSVCYGCNEGSLPIETNSYAMEDWGGGRATLVENLRIDGHAESFGAVGHVVISPDQELVVEQRAEGRIRFYDSAGILVGTFGKPGEGPGEFSFLAGLGYVSDTLWAWDVGLSRMTLISKERELLRTYSVGSLSSVPTDLTNVVSVGPVFPRGVRREGDILVQFTQIAGRSFPTHYSNHVVIGLIEQSGEFKDIVFSIENGGQVDFSIGTGGGTVPAPLRNPAYVAVSDDASRIVSAVTTMVGPQADSFSVSLWTSIGEEVWERQFQFNPVPLSHAVVDSVVDNTYSQFPPQFAEAFRREVRVPSAYPPLGNVVVAQDRSIWIEMNPHGDEKQTLVLDENGDVIGSVVLQANARVVVAGLDQIWVSERDDLDVESLVRYTLIWD